MKRKKGTEPWLERTIVFLLALTLLAPLVLLDGMFFPFITGKNLYLRAIVAFALVAAAAVLVIRRPATYRLTLIGASVFAFLAIMFAADLFATNPGRSFWGNFERMEGYVMLAHLGAWYFLASSFLSTTRRRSVFLATTLSVAGVVACVGLMQIAGALPINQGGVRVDAFIGNATYLAAYLLFHSFLAALAATKTKGFLRYGSLALLALFLVILYFASTRGAILGVFVGAGVSALLALALTKSATAKRFGAGILIALVLLGGGFLAVRDLPQVQQDPLLGRLAAISLEEGSTRFTMWGMAVAGVAERPLLGYGQENFGVVFSKHYTPALYAQEPWFDRAHNAFVDWLVAGGLLGFLAYLSLWVLALYTLWRAKPAVPPEERVLLTGLLVAYAVHSSFVFDNLLSYLGFFGVLAYIASAHGDRVRSFVVHVPEWGKQVAPVVLVILAVLSLASTLTTYARSSLLIAALSSPVPAERLALFDAALTVPFAQTGLQEVREQMAQAGVGLLQNPSVPQQVMNDYGTRVLTEMRLQMAQSVGDARIPILAAYFSRFAGRYDEALALLAVAKTQSPVKQQIYFEQALILAEQGKHAEAVAITQAAYDLARGYDDAAGYHAMALIRSGDTKAAKETLRAHFGTTTVPRQEVILAYMTVGDYDAATTLWNAKLASGGETLENLIGLARIRFMAKDTPGAVTAIERARTLYPAFAAEADAYLAEIQRGAVLPKGKGE